MYVILESVYTRTYKDAHMYIYMYYAYTYGK